MRRRGNDKYTIGCTTDGRAVYFQKFGKPIGMPLAFLRDSGMESHCDQLIELANKQARKKSIYLRNHLGDWEHNEERRKK